MNRLLRTMALGLSMAASLLALAAVKAAPGAIVSRPYDWTVEITTKQLTHEFRYHNSQLNPVIKADLVYFDNDHEDHKVKYESLWYAHDKALGLERLHDFAVSQGEAIAIRVKHSDGAGVEEQKASARAVMRAVLDANLNRNMVAVVKVPHGAFDTISSTIQEYDLQPTPENAGEEGLDVDLTVFLESEPAGQTVSLSHFH